MTDPTIAARTEIGLINTLFKAHNIAAGIDPSGAGSLITPQFWAYNVLLSTKETPERIVRLHQAITEIVTRQRQRPTPVRITGAPLTIEVPALHPRPITWQSAAWETGPHKMIAGRTYDIFSGAQQITIDLAKFYHALVVGSTGAGKSVLVQMLLLSLATNTSPRKLEFWFADLKNDDLRRLRDLPHVRHVATDERGAAALIERLHAEKERRKATHDYHSRIVFVVDEQAELAPLTAAVAQMNSILSVGRSIGINVIVATQEPTKAVLGGLSTRNFSVRLVGAVADANAAGYASGRAGSGAELLVRPGGFLAISGPTITRFQSYLIPEEEIAPVVAAIRSQEEEKGAKAGEDYSSCLFPLGEPVRAQTGPISAQPLVWSQTAGQTSSQTSSYTNGKTGLLPFEKPASEGAVSVCVQTYARLGTLNKTIAELWPSGDKVKRLDWLKGALAARGVTR